MKQKIDLVYFGRVPQENICFSKEQTISVLARKEDEGIYLPRIKLDIPRYLLEEAQKLVLSANYRPENVQNLRSLKPEGNNVTGVVNATNYGSLTALRKLIASYNDGKLKDETVWEDIYSLGKCIAALGTMAVLITPQMQAVIARKGRIQLAGKLCAYPGGVIEYDSDIIENLWKESMEESELSEKDMIETPYAIGLTRGMTHAGNPGVVFPFKTNYTLEDLSKKISAEEFDTNSLTPIDVSSKDGLRSGLKEHWNDSVDNSNGALLLLAAELFGREFFHDLVDELEKRSYAQISLKNPW